ncbi:MAG TPA: hypothetical protein VFC00_37695 [Micromonosporaceae bacterium]|nr:hypothetical protein [Micromonosporaceae bacterium]
MTSARPLRDVFSELATAGSGGDAGEVLDAHGHADLPDGLVAEAVVSYADTAPVEVAEHLAPFVMAHSAVYPEAVSGPADPAGWLDAVSTAPEPLVDDSEADLAAPDPDAADPADATDDRTDLGLDFGLGDRDPAEFDIDSTGEIATALDTAPATVDTGADLPVEHPVAAGLTPAQADPTDLADTGETGSDGDADDNGLDG